MVATSTRTSIGIDSLPPTRSKTRSCRTAQQQHLHVGRDLADLIEEDAAVVGQLETPKPAPAGAGESPGFVAEELTRQDAGGQGGAVDLDQ